MTLTPSNDLPNLTPHEANFSQACANAHQNHLSQQNQRQLSRLGAAINSKAIIIRDVKTVRGLFDLDFLDITDNKVVFEANNKDKDYNTDGKFKIMSRELHHSNTIMFQGVKVPVPHTILLPKGF